MEIITFGFRNGATTVKLAISVNCKKQLSRTRSPCSKAMSSKLQSSAIPLQTGLRYMRGVKGGLE